MKRPALKISLISVGFVLISGAIAGYWLHKRFLYTKPLTGTELQTLTPDWEALAHPAGSPWITLPGGVHEWNPVAAHNTRIDTIDDADRAWPIVIEVQRAYPELFNAPGLSIQYDPLSEGWSATRELLEHQRSREAADRLLDATLRPTLGRRLAEMTTSRDIDGVTHIFTFDPDEATALKRLGNRDHTLNTPSVANLSLFETDSPIVRDLNVARVLIGAANLALLEGNPDRYTALIEAADAWGRHIDEFALPINQTARMACASMCLQSIAWALDNDPSAFTDSHLQRLDITLDQLDQYRIEWRVSAMMMHDLVRRSLDNNDELSVTRHGDILSQPVPPSSTPDAQLDSLAQRVLYTINKMESMPAPSSDPSMTTPSATEWLRSQSGTMHHGAYVFLLAASISSDYQYSRIDQHIQDARPVRNAIAMQRHTLRHGEMPASIYEVDLDLRAD